MRPEADKKYRRFWQAFRIAVLAREAERIFASMPVSGSTTTVDAAEAERTWLGASGWGWVWVATPVWVLESAYSTTVSARETDLRFIRDSLR